MSFSLCLRAAGILEIIYDLVQLTPRRRTVMILEHLIFLVLISD